MRKCTDHPNRLEGWSTFQPGRLREIDVRFRHLPWNVDRLMDLLGIAGTLRVIDVGCGGGMFTRMIARHLDPASELVGIDIDPDMLAAARTESAREKLPLEIDWRPGEIDELPAPDRWADLTVCHTLLCNLVDVPRALVEMVRVTRPGGVVAAVEPSRRYLNYDPFISERLKQLSAKASRIVGAHLAWLRSRTQDPNPTPIPPEQLPARYPELFHRAGLTDVILDCDPCTFLLSDPRFDRDELVRWFADYADELDATREHHRTLFVGPDGMTEHEFDEYHALRVESYRRYARNPELIASTHYVQTSFDVIVRGTVPEAPRT